MKLHAWRPWRMRGKVRVSEGDTRNGPVEREQRKNKGTEPQPPNQRVQSQAGAGEHSEWKGHQDEGAEGGAGLGKAGGRQVAGRRVATAGQSHTAGEMIVPVALCQRPRSWLPEEWPSGGAWRFSRSLEHSVID